MFPVLERKDKAANYMFAVGVDPVDSQVGKSLQDSSWQESYQILGTVQPCEDCRSKAESLLKKGQKTKVARTESM